MTTTEPATTTPTPPTGPVQPRLGVVGTLRFVWRQLTSMRTALFLLLLLAVAAVPGSVLPQRGVNPNQVTAYLQRHPTSGPWLDRLGGFDVYASVWFSAIYLLLFVSLVGCVLPRTRQHLRTLRARPPRTPSRLDRLPAHTTFAVDGDPSAALAAARSALGRRFRVDVDEPAGALSAERGYLRESGNLVFHLSLVVLLVAVALGHLLGWRGDVVVPVGETFSNTVSTYDTINPGPWVDDEDLPPFSLTLRSMQVTFERDAAQRGAPREFRGTVSWTDAPGQPRHDGSIAVNHPLDVDGAKVYLLGNGYAPVITVRDSTGTVVYSEPTVFLPQDGSYTSTGVVKVTGAQPEQLGLVGQFLPTVDPSSAMPRSIFPDALNPGLLITALEGDLGLTSGAAQSVYTLDTDKMRSLRSPDGDVFRAMLQPGQTVQLPDGKGSVTFEKVQRYAALSIRHDPGKGWALGAALAAMAGLALSLFVPRRRVFVRVRPAPATAGSARDGEVSAPRRTLVEVGALARGEDAGLDGELDRLRERLGGLAVTEPDDDPVEGPARPPATTRRDA